jgi:hypothetical protein
MSDRITALAGKLYVLAIAAHSLGSDLSTSSELANASTTYIEKEYEKYKKKMIINGYVDAEIYGIIDEHSAREYARQYYEKKL